MGFCSYERNNLMKCQYVFVKAKTLSDIRCSGNRLLGYGTACTCLVFAFFRFSFFFFFKILSSISLCCALLMRWVPSAGALLCACVCMRPMGPLVYTCIRVSHYMIRVLCIRAKRRSIESSSAKFVSCRFVLRAINAVFDSSEQLSVYFLREQFVIPVPLLHTQRREFIEIEKNWNWLYLRFAQFQKCVWFYWWCCRWWHWPPLKHRLSIRIHAILCLKTTATPAIHCIWQNTSKMAIWNWWVCFFYAAAWGKRTA